MIGILTSPLGSLVQRRISHCGCIEHRVELLDLQDHLFTVLEQQRCEFVDYGTSGHCVMGWRAI
jgi:hypothetical protein